MDRVEFMKIFRAGIVKLPYQKAEAALAYYERCFEEAGPENEESVARELGDPSELAKRMMEEFYSSEKEQEDESITTESQTDKAQTNESYHSYDFSNKDLSNHYDFTNGTDPFNRDENKGQKSKGNLLLILLLIMAIPVIAPLVFGAIGVLIGVEVLLISLGLTSFILIVAGVVCLIVGIANLAGTFLTGVLVIGIALMLFGGALIMGLVTRYANWFINIFLLGGIIDLFTSKRYGRR